MPKLPGIKGSGSQQDDSRAQSPDSQASPKNSPKHIGTKESGASAVRGPTRIRGTKESGASIASGEVRSALRGSRQAYSSKESGASFVSFDSGGEGQSALRGSRAKYSSKESGASAVRWDHNEPDEIAVAEYDPGRSAGPERKERRKKSSSKLSNEDRGKRQKGSSKLSKGSDPDERQRRRHKMSTKDSMGSVMSKRSASSFTGSNSSFPTSDGSDYSGRTGRYTTKDTAGTGNSDYTSGTSDYSGSGSGSEARRSRKSKKDRKGKKGNARSSTRSRSRSTRGSHSRSDYSGSTGRSGSDWSSSSSEDLADQDLSLMDQSILPLHLRQGAIRTKEEAFAHRRQSRIAKNKDLLAIGYDEDEEEDEDADAFEWKDTRSNFKIFLSEFLGHETGAGFDNKEIYKESIMMDNWQLAYRVYPCIAWSVIVVFLLVLWTMRYYSPVELDSQRLLVQKVMVQTEAAVAAQLAPAFRVVSALALGARAGLFNMSSPYASVTNIVAPEMLAGPSVLFVQVDGASEKSIYLRPGQMHDEMLSTALRKPLVFLSPTPCEAILEGLDPMLCLGLNNSALIDVPKEGASMRWQRPAFMDLDGSGQYLAMQNWIFSHRLAARIDATNATTPSGDKGPVLGMQVGIDLSATIAAVSDTAPKAGETYICTSDGIVVAGSTWVAEATLMFDPAVGAVMYPRLWDLGLPWVSALSSSMIAGSRQAEGWHGTDIVMVRPLAIGDPRGGSYRTGLADLRIVSTVPRRVATSSMMKDLISGAMGVMGAPGVYLLLALVAACLSATFMGTLRWAFFKFS